MPTTLVTGAAGFVGANLVEHLLQAGWTVRGLVRDRTRAEHLENWGAELAIGTLQDKAALQQATTGVELVFHVAGRTAAFRREQYFEDNVGGSRNVLEACAAQPTPPTVVMVSSLAAGGPNAPGAPRRETDDDAPISVYGRSKLESELAIAEFTDRVPISIVRPPVVFGPRDHASLSLFRGIELSRLHVVPGWGRLRLSVVHVKDLCNALVRISEAGERLPAPSQESDRGTGLYYVTSGKTLTYREMGSYAAEALGRSLLVVPLPKAAFVLIGGATEVISRIRGKSGILTLDKVCEAWASSWECDDQKLRTSLGYQTPKPLEDHFAETVAWYRKAGWL